MMKRKIKDLIFNIIITTLFLVWIIDYSNVVLKKEPIFCITNKEHKYNDGTTNICNGLGYKIIKYNRDSITHGYTYGTLINKEIGVENHE